MKNFIFKSQQDFDLEKMFQYTFKRLDLILTIVRYNNDILKSLQTHKYHDTKLQEQVDKYFEETSPQTESMEHDETG